MEVQIKLHNLVLMIFYLDTLAVMGNYTEFARVYNLGIKYIFFKKKHLKIIMAVFFLFEKIVLLQVYFSFKKSIY